MLLPGDQSPGSSCMDFALKGKQIEIILFLTFSVEIECKPIKGIISLMIRKNFVKYDDFQHNTSFLNWENE